MKIGVIIQARMGSTRLSGKVMKELKGKTVLSHVIERVNQSKMIDDIIIATTT
jgi:spore coat polysaccharide biosynthesis protein SpsF